MPVTPQPNIFLAGTILSFPQDIQLTGTITVTGLDVIGTGTAFLTEIKYENNPGLRYKYLFNKQTGEIREIEGVYSDTKLVIKVAFAGAVSGDDLYVCDNYALASISIVPLGSGVEMFTVDSASTVIAANVEVSIKDNYGIRPIALNCVSDCQVLTD